MDNVDSKAQAAVDAAVARRDWSFMQTHMPRVVGLIREERAKGRGEHVNECWKRGVLGQQPGWFYAYENGVSVGVPVEGFTGDPALLELKRKFPEAVILILRNEVDAKEVRRGQA